MKARWIAFGILGLAVWLAALFRYEIQVVSAGPIAYRLDRWTGELMYVRGTEAKPVVLPGSIDFRHGQ